MVAGRNMHRILTEPEAYFTEKKEQYITQVRQKISEGKRVAIYGAGEIGQKLCRFLQKELIHVDFFCVTDSTKNPAKKCGLPVKGIREVDSARIEILIGVKRASNAAVVKTLREYGCENWVEMPEWLPCFLDERFLRPLIQVTTKVGCSVNCRHCPQELFVKRYFSETRPALMSFADYKDCLDKTPKDTVIEFAGFGEPFLNPETAEMMLYTASTGREVNLFTTLVGMTEEIWEKIKNIPFTMVVVHLPDAKQYAHIPLTEEYWKLLRTMVAAKKVTGEPFIDLTNSQSDILPEAMEIIKGKVKISDAQLIDRAGSLQSDELQHGGVPQGSLFCPTAARLDHNILLPDGSLVLCCMDFGMQHVIGNLLMATYEEIMQGKALKAIQCKMCASESDKLLCRQCIRAIALQNE